MHEHMCGCTPARALHLLPRCCREVHVALSHARRHHHADARRSCMHMHAACAIVILARAARQRSTTQLRSRLQCSLYLADECLMRLVLIACSCVVTPPNAKCRCFFLCLKPFV